MRNGQSIGSTGIAFFYPFTATEALKLAFPCGEMRFVITELNLGVTARYRVSLAGSGYHQIRKRKVCLPEIASSSVSLIIFDSRTVMDLGDKAGAIVDASECMRNRSRKLKTDITRVKSTRAIPNQPCTQMP